MQKGKPRPKETVRPGRSLPRHLQVSLPRGSYSNRTRAQTAGGTSLAWRGRTRVPSCTSRRGPECSPLCTAMTGRWCWVKLERRGESWGDGLLKGDLSISVFFTGDEMPVWGGARGSQGCRQGGSTPRTPASLLKALPLFLPAACGPGAGGLFYRWSKWRLMVEKGAARGLRPRCHHRPLTCPPGPSPFLIPETGPPRAARAWRTAG